MFFTNILLGYRNKFKPRKLPKGHLYRGKYRLVPAVTNEHVAQIKRDLVREDSNMFYLRHPYLLAVEYQGVPKKLFNEPVTFFNKCRESYYQDHFLKRNNPQHRTIRNHMIKSLMNEDRWE